VDEETKPLELEPVPVTKTTKWEFLDKVFDFIKTDFTKLFQALQKQNDDILVRLERIENLDTRILKKEIDQMAVSQDIKQLATQIDSATTAVADRIQKLIGQIQGGLSADEANQVIAQLQPIVTNLQNLGKDAENPVPPLPPETPVP
jgi:hypothetical protein